MGIKVGMVGVGAFAQSFIPLFKAHPPNNVWDAARYALPGIVAHESAIRGGILLEVPDLGDPHPVIVSLHSSCVGAP